MPSDDDGADERAEGGLERLVKHYRMRAEPGALHVHGAEARFIVGREQASLPSLQASAVGLVSPPGIASVTEEEFASPDQIRLPVASELLLQAAVIRLGEGVPEGMLVEAVMIPWSDLVREAAGDPDFLQKFDWRKMEEIVAAAYKASGFNVILTPRSGDRGRDVIATRNDIEVRIFDQVKKYASDQRVSADEVNSMLGVLTKFPNTSKAFVTTTGSFAPGIRQDPDLVKFMPYRLELRDRADLLKWFDELAKKSGGGS